MGVPNKVKRNNFIGISIGEAFREFIVEKEARNLAAPTLRNYKQSYEYFLTFNGYTDETSASEITQSNLYSWINSMKLSGVSPSGINHYVRDCRAFFYWCMDESREYIKAFKIGLVKVQEEPTKFFKDDDILLLLAKPKPSASFSEWRTWAIVNWVLGTGNRSSTICEIRIGDIDYKCKEIVLRHTKNRKASVIPLSTSLETIIKEYVHIWRRGANPEEYLFPNIGAEQLTTNSLRHSFSKYCKSRGVEQTNIHGLRHNFGRDWIRNSGNMFALQKILGHQTLEMVRHYVKLNAEDIKADFDQFSPLDNIKRASSRAHVIKRNK